MAGVAYRLVVSSAFPKILNWKNLLEKQVINESTTQFDAEKNIWPFSSLLDPTKPTKRSAVPRSDQGANDGTSREVFYRLARELLG